MTNMCCPHCGSKNIQVTTETNIKTTGKNYSGGKGCLGFLLLGPLGLLCGACGEGQKTTSTSTTYWVCPDCGNRFISPNDLRAKAKELSKNIPVCIFTGIIMAIAIYFIVNPVASMEKMDFPIAAVTAIIAGGLMSIVAPMALSSQANNMNKQADYLDEQMRKFAGNQGYNANTSYYANRAQVPVDNSYSNSSSVNNGYPVQSRRFCTGCGAEISDGAMFCSKCGKKTDGTVTTTAQTSSVNNVDTTPRVSTPVIHNNVPSAPPVTAGANEWMCPHCGAVNQNYVGTCGCGARRP